MKPHDAAVGNQGAEEEFMLPNLECGFYEAAHQEAEGDFVVSAGGAVRRETLVQFSVIAWGSCDA
jgi:hypothetical protein